MDGPIFDGGKVLSEWLLAVTVRPRVLVFVAYYLPGGKAGGSARSLTGLVEALRGKFEFRVVTSDRDLGESAQYPEIRWSAWYKLGNAWVVYLRPKDFWVATFVRLLRVRIKFPILEDARLFGAMCAGDGRPE